MFRILPYVEQNNLQTPLASVTNATLVADAINTIGSNKLNLFQCPSDARATQQSPGTPPTGGRALTSYLGVTGNDEWNENGFFGSNARNGVFAVHSWLQQTSSLALGVRTAQVTDGLSNTTFVGERPPAYNATPANDFRWGWWRGSDFNTLMANPNREASIITGCTTPGYFRPDVYNNPCAATHYWSLHPNGGNWLLGDGSVRFYTYAAGTPPSGVLPDMASINGSEVIRND
jgi:prepilin-type processing-associated H-X9-DG protein